MPCFASSVKIISRRAGLSMLFRLGEAQPASLAAGMQPGIRNGTTCFAKQRQQPADRTGKCHPARIPAHRLIKLKACDQTGQCFGKHLPAPGGPVSCTSATTYCPPSISCTCRSLTARPAPAGKTLGSLGRLALSIKGAAGRRAFHHGDPVRLLRREIFDQDHQAARRAQARAHRRAPGADRAAAAGIRSRSWARALIQVGSGQLFRRQSRTGKQRAAKRPRRIAARLSDGLTAGVSRGLPDGFLIRKPGESKLLALFDIRLSHAARKIAHAAKKRLALGHAHCAARIQNIEGVRALEDVIVRGKHQAILQRSFGLGLKQVVHLAQAVDIRDFKIILAVFLLALQIHVPIACAARSSAGCGNGARPAAPWRCAPGRR